MNAKLIGRPFVSLDSLPVVMPEDAALVEEQFMDGASMSEAHSEPHSLNVGWMILNPEKSLPSMEEVKKFFKRKTKHTHQLVSLHKNYLTNVSDSQRFALQEYQMNPEINNFRATGQAVLDICASFDVDKHVDKKTIVDALATQIPLKQVNQAMKGKKKQEKLLTRIIREAPRLPKGKTYPLFRGVGLAPQVKRGGDKLPELTAQVGDTLHWDRFSSFSISPLVALAFKGTAPCCIFRLQWDSAVPGVVLPLNLEFKEFEVLLPPGKYEVTRVTKLKSPYAPTWHLKVIDIKFLA